MIRFLIGLWRAFLSRESEYMRKYQLGAEIFHSGRPARTPAEVEAFAIWEAEQW